MAQHTGTAAWVNSNKGFGFLKADGIEDVFCPFSAIQSEGYESLDEGARVEFDVEYGTNGPQAANVRHLK